MIKIVMVGAMAMVMAGIISSCSDQNEVRKETTEDRLINSFRGERPELQEHVEQIVKEARALQYQLVMNKLALLSATRRLSKEQQIAVDLLSKQLRFDMEEELFRKRERQE